jgi:hypothetical protein
MNSKKKMIKLFLCVYAFVGINRKLLEEDIAEVGEKIKLQLLLFTN